MRDEINEGKGNIKGYINFTVFVFKVEFAQ